MTYSSTKSKIRKSLSFTGKSYYIICIVLALLLSNITTWFLSYRYYSQTHSRVTLSHQQLSEQNRQLLKQHEMAEIQISELKHTRKIDKLTIECTRKTITQLEEKQNILTHQIGFYRKFLAPDQEKSSIQLQDVILLKENNDYYLQLTVVHVDQSPPVLGGTLSITLHGSENGQQKTYNLLALAKHTQTTETLGFRYFQTIPKPQEFINFHLPNNFLPETLSINLSIKKGRKRNLEQYYRWNTLLDSSDKYMQLPTIQRTTH